MRITSETMVMRSVDRLQSRMANLERSQSELATGRRILKPSDDPAGARRASSLRSAMGSREQELKNASDARGWLNAADNQLQSAMSRLSRIRDLTTQGAKTEGDTARRVLADEVREIIDELAGIANTKHLDRPLFGGYTGGLAVERNADGDWVTNGDGDQVTRRVSDTELVRANVTAAEWLGTGDDNLLGFLDGLVHDLEHGTPNAVSARLEGLATATDRVATSLSRIGTATNRVDSAARRAEDLLLTLRTELSDVEDVDIAKGVMELQLHETAYEATLQALGRSLPPSLAAFLR